MQPLVLVPPRARAGAQADCLESWTPWTDPASVVQSPGSTSCARMERTALICDPASQFGISIGI